MTKPPNGFSRNPIDDGEYPPDLYDPDEVVGTPLETLPMPTNEEVPSGTSSQPAEDEGSGGWDPTRPIGPGNPPRKHAFAKGKSGNPKGPPVKSADGPITKLMNQTLTIVEDGKTVQITKREKLDRLVAIDACKSTKGLKLLQERTERAKKIDEQRQACQRMEEERRRKREANPSTAAQRFYERRCEVHEAQYQAIQSKYPGYDEAYRELERLDAVEIVDGQYQLKEAVQRYL
jgi:hypothetical protein